MRAVTVFTAETKPVTANVLEAFASAVGTPRDTVSPSAAPVTVIVRLWQLLAAMIGKSREAVALKCFVIAVPPAMVRAPAELNVEVAVPPKYAVPTLDNSVEDALPSEVKPVTESVPAAETFPVRVDAPVTLNVDASDSAPVDEKVEVAVAPKYALLKTENAVEEALPSVVSPVTLTVPSVLILLPMVVAACTTVTTNSTEKTTEKNTEIGPDFLKKLMIFDIVVIV